MEGEGWRTVFSLPLKRCTLSLCFVCLFVCLSVCFWCDPLPHGGCCCVLRGLLFHLVAHELPCRERWTPQRSPHRRFTPQRCCRWPSIGSFGRCALAPHGNVSPPLPIASRTHPSGAVFRSSRRSRRVSWSHTSRVIAKQKNKIKNVNCPFLPNQRTNVCGVAVV